MIIIDRPFLEKCGDNTRLQSLVHIDGREEYLWFQVKNEYAACLTVSRGDAFLVGLLFYALKYHHDIHLNVPVSERLYYQLTTYLIDFLVRVHSKEHLLPIRIFADTDHSILSDSVGVGTGISCGIDSFATIGQQANIPGCEHISLTHLCFFNVGAHGSYGGEQTRQLFLERKQRSEQFCREYGYAFVELESNLTDIIKLSFVLTHTYRNCAAVLALGGLFRYYFYASGYSVYEFLYKDDDPAYFDTFLLSMLSTESTTFYSSEVTMNRLEKTRIVADYEPSYRYLNVCTSQNENCGKCEKCSRTLLALDVVEKLECYSEVFDIGYYQRHRNRYLQFFYSEYLLKNSYYIALYPYLKKDLNFLIRIGGVRMLVRKKILLRRVKLENYVRSKPLLKQRLLKLLCLLKIRK